MTPVWLNRLFALTSALDRGKAGNAAPASPALKKACRLAYAVISEKGEASGAALARELTESYRALDAAERLAFFRILVAEFAPDPEPLQEAAEAYAADPTPEGAMLLFEAAEPPRQEVLRRMNMAPGGTAQLVAMRAEILGELRRNSELRPLDSDLRHLFASWFNRGFLELRRIDWNTPASILEKLIAYEAVHEIQGWDDLRRRLAPDRRCFAFFHPALGDEPLIFVEVALVRGIAGAIQPLLARGGGEPGTAEVAKKPDAAIFYSISNCQPGLRGISFGNFLIKQVVEELRQEIPSLNKFATLSPVPGFRRWLERRITVGARDLLRPEDRTRITALTGKRGAKGAFQSLLTIPDWPDQPDIAAVLRGPLMRLCAEYLTDSNGGRGPSDPVARFHLGNGARLERINWLGNVSPRGIAESYGLMVNYLYNPDRIEANHEVFARSGTVVRSDAVESLLREGPAARSAATLRSLVGGGSSGRRSAPPPPRRLPAPAPATGDGAAEPGAGNDGDGPAAEREPEAATVAGADVPPRETKS